MNFMHKLENFLEENISVYGYYQDSYYERLSSGKSLQDRIQEMAESDNVEGFYMVDEICPDGEHIVTCVNWFDGIEYRSKMFFIKMGSKPGIGG